MEAIDRGDAENAARIFLDGVIGTEGYFNQLPSNARTMIMENVKSLSGELASITQRFTCEDAIYLRLQPCKRRLRLDIFNAAPNC